MKPLRNILVANRGEIACRIMRSIRALGKEACAIYSEVDRESPHVLMADRSRCVGPAPAAESYLDIAKVVAAAVEMGCDGVHPGYGFLSENARFAVACEEAGLVFLGPSPAAIRAMGDKGEARRRAAAVGTLPVPGYEGDDDFATLAREASRIGFPLLVKAAMGGGGKGMRRVAAMEELETAMGSARREASAAFGSGALILERYVHPARHVEVQLLGDHHGCVVPLLERECSLQRRHQKVLEECPSPAVTPEVRQALQTAAVRLAESVGYVGAGTVEFLLEDSGAFWFLEMNTRLQVEHGVTELVTGQDLVAWQIRIAEGARLADAFPGPVESRGHAVEARVYAESPASGFLPQAGPLLHLRCPEGPGLRVDHGLREGQMVTPHYDPMLMKVMGFGRDRAEATQKLMLGLEGLEILGVQTNVGYLLHWLSSDAWNSGRTFTHTLESAGPYSEDGALPPEVLALAALGLTQKDPGSSLTSRSTVESRGPDPYQDLGSFRLASGAQGGSAS